MLATIVPMRFPDAFLPEITHSWQSCGLPAFAKEGLTTTMRRIKPGSQRKQYMIIEAEQAITTPRDSLGFARNGNLRKIYFPLEPETKILTGS
ncbi:MAG: hypothetical protein H0U72_14055 [Nitrosospira sp.]|nr:hypothetical protein [Nitrosospira sp.]